MYRGFQKERTTQKQWNKRSRLLCKYAIFCVKIMYTIFRLILKQSFKKLVYIYIFKSILKHVYTVCTLQQKYKNVASNSKLWFGLVDIFSYHLVNAFKWDSDRIHSVRITFWRWEDGKYSIISKDANHSHVRRQGENIAGQNYIFQQETVSIYSSKGTKKGLEGNNTVWR